MEAMVDGAARLADDKPWPLSHWRPSVMASQCVAQINAHLAGVRWDDHGAELPSNVVGVTASAGVPSATRIRLHSPTPSPGQERESSSVCTWCSGLRAARLRARKEGGPCQRGLTLVMQS